jgi:tRNA threonylcarbamoyladenosine biosynthesis protein TsaB
VSASVPRILAIETSGHAGSVALGEDGRVVAAREISGDRKTARMLAPAIREVLAEVGWQPRDVGLVAVGIGPGSFTGLRLGVTTAKAFAYAVGAEILGLDTREILAAGVSADAPRVHTVLDAQRGELFVGRLVAAEPGGPRTLQPGPVLWSEADFLASLVPGDVVTGPVLDRLAAKLPAGVLASDRATWIPQAKDALALAARDWLLGRRDDPLTLLPEYGRASAAEEKRAARR